MMNGPSKVNNGYVSDQPKNEQKIELNESGRHEINADDDNKKKKAEKVNMVPIFNLYRFATKWDVCLMIIGTLGSAANGAAFPLMMVLFTNIIDTFTESGLDLCSLNVTALIITNSSVPMPPSEGTLVPKLREQAIYLSILGAATMVVSYFQVAFWLMPAERQVRVIRRTLFRSILKQEIGWFDTYKVGELTTRLSDDINKIKEGLGDKFGSAIQFVSTFITGMIIGFVRGWKLTLVILSLSPILFVSAVLFTKLAGYLTSNELKSYAKAGAIAEEVFTAIRTVFAFNGARKEHARYEKNLEDARVFGIKKSSINGTLLGFVWLIINGAYALGFWYGWTLTQNIDANGEPEYTVGKILLVFFSIIMAVFSLGNAAPFAGSLATARAAAYEVYKIIDREPSINSESEEGVRPQSITGDIEFRNVHFKYPSRPDAQVLNDMSFSIRAGTTVALVGSSGCGKSTCIQLLQRFYDPLAGQVCVDNMDIRDFNINCLRDSIGVVNQEPILFQTSIADNIRMGRDGVTMNDVVNAAKDANAHDFIMQLPQQYETQVGNRGSQLSGGQKQRVAIARALIRNPKILLLDEATSALDNESESIVQSALDKARLGRTTIVVAHRLTTIRNVDVIYALDKGTLVEHGSHDELMKRQGVYYSLVCAQGSAGSSSEAETEKPHKLKRSRTKSVKDEQEYTFGTKTDSNENLPAKRLKEVSMSRLFDYNRPEWIYIIIACLAALVSGAVQPAFSIVFSKVIAVFQKCDMEEQRRDINLYCLLFVAFGVITFISYFLQGSMFGISGENLTRRLRSLGFQKMLSQDVAWFDDPANDIGTLCTRLAVDAAAVQGATGVRIGFVLMNIGNLGIGIVIAFVYSWAITLCILAFVPFMIISGVLQTKMLTGFSGKDKEVLEEAGQITNQAIGNIRTVAILNKEKYFYEQYADKFEAPYRASLKSANMYAAMFGFTNSIMFYAIAAAYYLGAYLVDKELYGLTFEKIMLVFSCIIFGAQSVGQASSFMPDYTKAKIAFQNLCELFDRVPAINNWECASTQVIRDEEFNGNVQINSISFRYPTRPDAQVLQDMTIHISKGQRIALVGSSGCGKSTITQLLERYYDSDSGEIKLSDYNIRDLNLFWLRSQIGIVSQEPILFDATIAENIAYGDTSRTVSMDEIVEAARKANIHDFIMQLPDAYQTNAGSKGTQLSGGQKQRVAIARALIRNPKILLLDEATSALDTESEKIVQDALDKAQEGRTCIIIAHRLSTIKNADIIYVIKDGRVIESGTHDWLIKLDGFYNKLYTSSH